MAVKLFNKAGALRPQVIREYLAKKVTMSKRAKLKRKIAHSLTKREQTRRRTKRRRHKKRVRRQSR